MPVVLAAVLLLGGCGILGPKPQARMTVENREEPAPAPDVYTEPEEIDTAPVLAAPSSSASQEITPPQATAADAHAVRPLGVGDRIPDLRLLTSEGAPIDLADLVQSRPTVLIFYRGGWCPYCNTHLSELQTAEAELQQMGFRVAAISPDRPAKLRETTDKLDLSYMLLSDSKAEAARAFGLAFTVDDQTIQRYLTFGINLDDASGEPHHQLPVPAVFIVDTTGTIRYRYYEPDYTVRLSRDELLAQARAVK